MGAIVFALTLSGSAWGQTLGVVGSVVDTTTESLQPVTQTVTKVAEPVLQPAAKAQPAQPAEPAEPAQSEPAASAPASSPATRAVTQATQPVAATVRTATTAVRATRSVEPVATGATRTVTRTLAATTAALPPETQALLGPLVETIDGQAEELTGSLLGPRSSTTVGGVVRAVTGVLMPTQEGVQGSSSGPWGGGFTQEGSPPVFSGTSARGPEPRSARAHPAPVVGGELPLLPPAQLVITTSEPAATPDGARRAGESGSPTAPPAGPERSAPAAPASAFGSSSAPAAAFAVLAGLFALALAAFLGRLLPWSDTVRPLAFVLPPERPG